MAANPYLAINPATGNPKNTVPSVTSAANAIVAMDSTGHIDTSVLPVGLTIPTQQIIASESLSAGNLVNIYNNSGTANCRKADGSTTGKSADGFVLSAVTALATATVYFPGDENTAVTALTPGPQFLSDTTPGACSTTIPSTAGHVIQRVGDASTATNLIFQPGQVIEL
jgi:hypothetical protein